MSTRAYARKRAERQPGTTTFEPDHPLIPAIDDSPASSPALVVSTVSDSSGGLGHDFGKIAVQAEPVAMPTPQINLHASQTGDSQDRVIQRQVAPAQSTNTAASDETDVDGSRALRAASDILQFGLVRLIGDVEPGYRVAVENLYIAKSGVRDGKQVSGVERLQLFDEAFKQLRPALSAFARDRENRAWLAQQVTPYADQLRESLNLAKAQERVSRAVLGSDSKLIELPPDSDPHAEAALLHSEIPKLQETIKVLAENARNMQEQLARAGEAALRGGGHGAPHGEPQDKGAGGAAHAEPGSGAEPESEPLVPELKKPRIDDPRSMLDLQNMLKIVDGYLILTDDEFAENLSHIQELGVFRGIATFAEFVKAVIELIGGTVAVTASAAAGMAAAKGEAEMANAAFELAEGASGFLGNVIAGIEIVHGIAVLLDKRSTGEEKVGAVRDIAVGAGWFGGWYFTGSMLGGTLASSALLMLYYDVRLVAEFQEAREGIVGMWMEAAFEALNDAGRQISHDASELAKAGLLLEGERDPGQRRALQSIVTADAQGLGAAVDDFLEDCNPVGYGPGAAYKPGAYVSLRAQFAPLASLAGAHTPDTAAAAAIAVMEKLSWCFKHARDLLNQELGYGAPAKGSPIPKTSD